MGFVFRKRLRATKRTGVNLSKSGASASRRGRRVTVNSKGKGSVRVGKGISFRF